MTNVLVTSAVIVILEQLKSIRKCLLQLIRKILLQVLE